MTNYQKTHSELFTKYIERKPRCEAVRLWSGNIWQVAQYLREVGFGVKVDASGPHTLEVSRDSTILLTANVDKGDAIIWSEPDLICVPGIEFREKWERDNV